MEKNQNHVGIIGLGIIGSRISDTLKQKGWEVSTWNRTKGKDPNSLSSPAEVVKASKYVQIFVRDGNALHEVIDNFKSELTPDHVIINHATISLEETKLAYEIIASQGASFLDCPFTGSRDAAAGGKLNYYVGGDEKILHRVSPLLKDSSNSITHLGQIGTATVFKIATNMISATTVAILAESLAVCEVGEVKLEKMLEAMSVNACSSGLTNMKLPTMLEGNYEPHFSLKNMLKDAEFGLSMADTKGIQLPVLKAAAQSMQSQMKNKRDDEDYSVVYRNFTD